ncbi:MAG: hypothetical protein UX91_C0007G0050 [Candidatus Amesbacteria bacterium GW2011_GWB1_47_19]|nr:MAG: hypothetical protein UW51_C0006G0129 [Candidatus Amesbacteria bacterium GW2011_GWA1_44_24]KKU31834.1 MAG: hypothetical protein UX46_C0002G0050 [Candidatus Amesbacteria bacterium GW2011_GWC1_46_24]KKU66770.1 MAG: hypothetical protein UX91_C0007G0050 [Candidatus Amesbacteria bacterium GW2011_GWB1_47_19]
MQIMPEPDNEIDKLQAIIGAKKSVIKVCILYFKRFFRRAGFMFLVSQHQLKKFQ